MPRYRKLHTKIIDSFDFNEMPNDFTRVCWLLLIVGVDSEGRGIDNPAWIHSKILPMRSDISFQDIDKAFDWLASREMIMRYQVGGRDYFYIPSFKKYQSGTEKEAASVLPSPDLLQTNSGPTPEENKTNSTTSVYEYDSVSASVTEDVSVNVPDPFDVMKSTCERLTGRLMVQGDIGAINKFVEQEIIEDDICNAIKWWSTTDKVITRIGQLENSVLYQKGQRMQKLTGGKNGGEKRNSIQSDGGLYV